MTDLVVIPFHDWRKVQREGNRTRDAHLIRCLADHPDVRNVIIINRPVSLAEMLYTRSGWQTTGEVISRTADSQLVGVGEKLFAIDFKDSHLIAPVVSGKKFFFNSYGSDKHQNAIAHYLKSLGIYEYDCISFSVYAAQLLQKLPARRTLFDAWDNFLKFPANKSLTHHLKDAYSMYASHASVWTTNSDENRQFYLKTFGIEAASVIKNGVDISRFQLPLPLPADLAALPRPIAGMGLKVTHLLDTELLNFLTETYPDISFVLVGQILDHAVFKRIIPRPNFHYLGDKHYDSYAAYVKHFDIGLIPYCVGDKQHGGDAIKFYEYLAANKPVVSTRGNGVTDDYPAVWIADSYPAFGRALTEASQRQALDRRLPTDLTWQDKADMLLSVLLACDKESVCRIPVK